MPDIEQFFAACFDPEDEVWPASKEFSMRPCYARSQDWSIERFVGKNFPGGAYLAVNAGTDRRNGENVQKCRTFLLEFDSGSLAEQAIFFERVKEMPFTAKVFSAGKSIHYWLTLETPLGSIGEYKEWFRRLWLYLDEKPDEQCQDPCRYARFPGAFRDGVEQRLSAVNSRVPNQAIRDRIFTPEITKRFEDRYSGQHVGNTYLQQNMVPLPKKLSYLRRYYPLVTGQKQANMFVWAKQLVGSCRIFERDKIVEILKLNDQGSHKLSSEYERAADRALVIEEAPTELPPEFWEGDVSVEPYY
jgi:hypothetical protein